MMIRGNSSVQYMEKQKSPLKRGLLFSVLSSFWSSLILENAQETFPLSVIPHFRTRSRNISSFCHPSFLMIIKNVKGSIPSRVISRNAFAFRQGIYSPSESSLETLLRFVKGSTILFNPKIAGRFC